MSTVFANGREIHYSDTGEKSQPTLVLAHGFFMDRSMFLPQNELADSWRIITWDARGHGESAPDEIGDGYSYWEQARDCISLLDALGIESATVGGMSQGGYIALRVALLNPERVNGLILIDTEAGASDDAEVKWYEDFFDSLIKEGPVDDLMIPISQRLIGPRDDLREPWIKKWRSTNFTTIGAAARCLMYREDLTSRLSEITCPTVVIHGSLDEAVPVATAEKTADLTTGSSRLVIVDGGSHSSNLTHPSEVNEAIRSLPS